MYHPYRSASFFYSDSHVALHQAAYETIWSIGAFYFTLIVLASSQFSFMVRKRIPFPTKVTLGLTVLL